METHNYEKLTVWQKSMDLVVGIYGMTGVFPKEEIYGLTSQMKRAAVSIPSNIAEGCRRKTNKDFSHFLTIAFGSGAELETQLRIAKRLKFYGENEYVRVEPLLQEVMRMLNKLISSLPTTN